MKREPIIFYLILIFFMICLSYGFTEESTEENIVSVPRQLSLFLVFKGNFDQEETLLLKQSLLIKIAEDDDINLVEPVIEEDLTPDMRNIKADELKSDCWLAVLVTAKTETIEIVYSSYDLINKKFVIEEKKFIKDRKIRSLQRSFWKDIIIDIANKYSQVTGKLEIKEVVEYKNTTKDAVQQKGVKVVFEGNPGTSIQGLSEEALVVNERGIARIELAQASTYKMKAVCPGYYSLEQSFYVGFEPVKITLKQEPASRIALDAYLHEVDYLGGGFVFYLIPNYYFLELSITTYIKKLIWPVEKGDTKDYESPLFPVFLTFGFYVNEEDSFFRYGFNAGVFIRLFYDNDRGIILDPVAGWGVKLFGFHAELSTLKKIRFFYEQNVLVYITENPNLLSDNDMHAINFFDIKLGVRFIL
ncbi:MAG: hypothetical protein JXB88_07940 [Spirochaetales bacterium]|nr:hypothetical protein [Spirochaetales bacterium]